MGVEVDEYRRHTNQQLIPNVDPSSIARSLIISFPPEASPKWKAVVSFQLKLTCVCDTSLHRPSLGDYLDLLSGESELNADCMRAAVLPQPSPDTAPDLDGRRYPTHEYMGRTRHKALARLHGGSCHNVQVGKT